MADRLLEMQAFLQAVETGSFAAAAARLGVSAQMVGKHVAAVEQRLGTRLLNRSTRQQSLTEAGHLYLEGCRRALAEVEAAEARVTAQADTPRGTLRVTAPVAFGSFRLVPDATRFLARYPEVRLHVELTDRCVNLVKNGFDAAFRIGEQPDSSLFPARSRHTGWFPAPLPTISRAAACRRTLTSCATMSASTTCSPPILRRACGAFRERTLQSQLNLPSGYWPLTAEP